ncbi:MAG: hypothetical protein IDH49_00315 [Gammaproteobacteria bacterium]|nr:hypothetical protein [Gammaproteobacteria bacterium]
MRAFAVVLLGLFLMSCGVDNQAPSMPSQTWKKIEVSVETRAGRARGMNEFLVITTRKPKRPVFDLVVSMRMSESDPWKQAIQDGHVGVYRRSLMVTDPATQTLFVHIKQKEEETVLRFPLKGRPSP